MAIVIPFRKPLAITFQMPPSYGPLKQWLNSNWAKTGKKCNFFVYTPIFFPSVANCHPQQMFWAPEEKLFLRKKHPIFLLFLICRLYVNVTYFVFCAPPKSQPFRISVQNFRVLGPFLQVSLHWHKTFVLGDNLPHLEKNWSIKKKVAFFAYFVRF